MNTEMYIKLAIVLAFILLILKVYYIQQKWIKMLQAELKNRSDTISELTDRLMAKSLDQYKLWTQTPDEVPPQTPEEIIDDSGVGQITGSERFV